ncbi:MAG: serine acetyltransferase [Alphaproteobacteria bacterium]|nr:MAG: serine acetyltransferase [Alphaproteobacteria bacterium]
MDADATPAPALTGAALIRAMGLRAILAEDIRTHRGEWSRPGLQALIIHRIGVWATTLPRPWRWPFDILYAVGFRFCRNFYGIELRRTARIGRRLEIGHQHGIVIHDHATIGDDCVLRQGVTFGIANEWIPGRGPVIGNRVSFGPGTAIIGNITIGDDVQIGPNCVISADVPAGRTLFVPPPRVIPREVPPA